MEQDFLSGLDKGSGGMPEAVIVAITLVTLFLSLLPVIAALTRSRVVLTIAAALLSAGSVGALVLSLAPGVGGLVFLPFAGTWWFAGLFCGLAVFLDAAAEKREREMTFRLLHNDAKGLPVPSALRN